ncbi:unnamed protein product [marine sediment metagenome]|uniref:Uncharacterized protein n=1 Tax=marine sediment metagenome TaxID=412755 RepID=X0W7L7_9ZZZZ
MTEKTWWIDGHRFLTMIIVLLIMWSGFFVFFYLKADEVTRDPCSICAEYMGDNVICTTSDYIPIHKVYYPNGSEWTEDSKVHVEPELIPYNFTPYWEED